MKSWVKAMPAGMKSAGLYFRHRLRMRSADDRAFPEFLIVGAQKAGTSSLYDYICQHPRVLPALGVKEVHFFDLNFSCDEKWYRAHFRLRAELVERNSITGEATPYYMFHPYAMARIREILPAVKIIVLLRDPVQRALSHYFHEVRYGVEVRPLEAALELEEDRIGPEYEKMMCDRNYNSESYQHFSYKKRGIYSDQLEQIFENFDRDQVLVLRSEELFKTPQNTMKDVFRFLGLDPGVSLHDLMPRNTGAYHHDVSEWVRESLEEFFRPHNRRLFELLDWTTPWNTVGGRAIR